MATSEMISATPPSSNDKSNINEGWKGEGLDNFRHGTLERLMLVTDQWSVEGLKYYAGWLRISVADVLEELVTSQTQKLLNEC